MVKMRMSIAACMLFIPSLAPAQQADKSMDLRNSVTVGQAQPQAKKSMNLPNSPSARVRSSTTITANVTNRSRKDATNGTVVFDNEYASCSVGFGAIHAQGGSASGSCILDGYALTAKAAFNAADGTHWVGIAGDGQAFDTIDINLNDPR
jgi:hypothetical protein